MSRQPRPPRTSIRIVRELFEIVDVNPISTAKAARDASIYRDAPTKWRHGLNAPTVDLLEDFALQFGYRLRWEKTDAAED
jgi:hypothetical protein